MHIPVMSTLLYEYYHMNTADKEVIKIGCVFGTIAKRTKNHTFVRFKNNDIPRLQSKEDFINSHLNQWARDGKIPMYTSHNKRINGCSARPDFGYNLATHRVLVEVDEHQHDMPYRCHVGYKPRDEFQRMCDLCATADKPIVIIRYNPDAFQIDGKTHQIETADRVALLLARLEYYLTLAVVDNFITAEYLFYSQCPQADDNPLIGCFSFSDPQSMNNWIKLFGANWDTSTICDAIECARFKLQAVKILCQTACILDGSSENLCTKYKNTTLEMFDAWLPEQRTLYAGNKMVDAYNRLNRFRSYGPNHTAALANLKAVQEGQYEYIAVAMADEMLRMYTGVGDPYQCNQMFESAVQKNLECTCEGTKMVVSKSKSQTIFNIYKRWIALDPLHHTPSYIIPETDKLNYKQAMTILNQILRFMNVMMLIRTGKRFGGKRNRDHLLIMDKFSYFAEELDSTDKPALDQWNQSLHPPSDTCPYQPSVSSVRLLDKRKREEPKQMTTMEKIDNKKRQRKVHDEKLKQISLASERRQC